MSNNELVPFREYMKNTMGLGVTAFFGLVESVTVLCLVALAPIAYPLTALYLLGVQGRSNCLVWAVWCKVRNRKRRIVCVRNARGRRHWQVVGVDGSRWEWYAKGASQRSRLANLWHRGEARKVSK